MIEVVPVHIDGGLSESGCSIMMMKEKDGGRMLPIVIGVHEAQSLLMAREGKRPMRPSTHNLFIDTLATFGLRVYEATVDSYLDGVFYSTLHVTDGFNQKKIDSRASDAITLALLSDAPVYMHESILDTMGRDLDKEEEEEKKITIEDLEHALERCEEMEDYEQAAQIQEKIDILKKEK